MNVDKITSGIAGSLTNVSTGTGKLTQAAQTAAEKGGQELTAALECLAGANKASIDTVKLPSGYSEFVNQRINKGANFQEAIKDANDFFGLVKHTAKSAEESAKVFTHNKKTIEEELIEGINKALLNKPDEAQYALGLNFPDIFANIKQKGVIAALDNMTPEELLEVLNSVFIYIPRQS